ncbi:MAG: hypothetical protein ACOYB2_02505 [Limnohabitans sp.]
MTDKDAEEQSVPSLTAGWSGIDDVEIPSILRRWPTTDTPAEAVILLANIDNRTAWLAERGLWPHPDVIQRRAEVAAIVEANAMLERVTQAKLKEPTRCLTPLLGEIDRETSEAIEQIASVTRPTPLKPPEVFNGLFHNPRRQPTPPPKPGLVRRFVRWLGLSR